MKVINALGSITLRKLWLKIKQTVKEKHENNWRALWNACMIFLFSNIQIRLCFNYKTAILIRRCIEDCTMHPEDSILLITSLLSNIYHDYAIVQDCITFRFIMKQKRSSLVSCCSFFLFFFFFIELPSSAITFQSIRSAFYRIFPDVSITTERKSL